MATYDEKLSQLQDIADHKIGKERIRFAVLEGAGGEMEVWGETEYERAFAEPEEFFDVLKACTDYETFWGECGKRELRAEPRPPRDSGASG